MLLTKLLENVNNTDYLKWKRNNVTLRGMKSKGESNQVYASFGNGLYTVPLSNKKMAKEYGDVYFVVNAIPKKPKVVSGINDAELVRQGLINDFCKKHGESYSPSFFNSKTTMEDEMIKRGFDGLIIKGREMVNYSPPDNVLYFQSEDELKDYYELKVRN